MKVLLSTLFIAATVGFAPSAFAVDNSISSLCDGSDTGYNRAGGYCSQVASNASLFPTGRVPDCPAFTVRDEDTGACVCVY